MEPNVPNLDCMTVEGLKNFYFAWRGVSNETAQKLVGNAYNPKLVAEYLALYALCKSCAMKYRLGGMIQEALRSEEECDEIYAKLPYDCQW
jgi:hypothetical protein